MARKSEHPAYAEEGSSGRSYRLPSYGSPVGEPAGSSPPAMRMPGVDDRLAVPEAGEEYFDGVRYEVMAGESEHADPQCQLAYVVRACVAEGYVASTELLTRSDIGSDFATDVCVRQAGEDPRTGQRYLEEVSFEVANTQTLADLAARARTLVARGVRRVFAVMVAEQEVREWLSTGWRVRPQRSEIRDRVFKRPLRIRAIVDAADADRLVAEALWAKREPFLVRVAHKERAEGRAEGHAEGRAEGRAEGHAEGHAEGLAEAIFRALERHGIAIASQERAVLLASRDTNLLTRWLDKVLVVDTAMEVVTELGRESCKTQSLISAGVTRRLCRLFRPEEISSRFCSKIKRGSTAST